MLTAHAVCCCWVCVQARPQDGEPALFYPQRPQQEEADPGHGGLAAAHRHHAVPLLPHAGPAHRHRL